MGMKRVGMKMNSPGAREEQTEPAPERIVVALDASSHSLAALRAAAELAAQLRAELHGLFVEDATLLRLCELPFFQEVGLFSARPRRIESQALERQFRALARSLREQVARVAEAAHVPWTFRVTRGSVADELLAAAEEAQLLSLGRLGQGAGKRAGSATEFIVRRTRRPVLVMSRHEQFRPPLTLVYTGSPASERALELAVRLAERMDKQLHLVLPMTQTDAEQISTQLRQRIRAVEFHVTRVDDVDRFAQLLQTLGHRTVIMPAEFAELLPLLNGPVLLTP